ncbi:hypothetical protein EVAR_9129_1 [Eumeta japonica]|uniref:Uncharacterized protein n=1 Tax=Eumeta variegata TaxID=151549 RepID=A0A4C1TW61_EUMVA|nr:hypothetical protein EVAR_9129_1 [Eumeta japonica]
MCHIVTPLLSEPRVVPTALSYRVTLRVPDQRRDRFTSVFYQSRKGEAVNDGPETSGSKGLDALQAERLGRSYLFIACSALSLARSAQAERDNESCFIVRAAGVHRFISRHHVKTINIKHTIFSNMLCGGRLTYYSFTFYTWKQQGCSLFFPNLRRQDRPRGKGRRKSGTKEGRFECGEAARGRLYLGNEAVE